MIIFRHLIAGEIMKSLKRAFPDSHLFVNHRKLNGKGCACSRLAFAGKNPSVPFYDPAGDSKPQSSADLFGGKKGVENFFLDFRGYPGACILYM